MINGHWSLRSGGIMIVEMVRESSILGLLGLAVSLVTVGVALAYAIRPSERTLSLMRPLTLAALFGGLSSFSVGAALVLQGISAEIPTNWRLVAAGASETVASLFFAFGCLTIAWLLVALGLRRAA
jgi:hypothetical protein